MLKTKIKFLLPKNNKRNSSPETKEDLIKSLKEYQLGSVGYSLESPLQKVPSFDYENSDGVLTVDFETKTDTIPRAVVYYIKTISSEMAAVTYCEEDEYWRDWLFSFSEETSLSLTLENSVAHSDVPWNEEAYAVRSHSGINTEVTLEEPFTFKGVL